MHQPPMWSFIRPLYSIWLLEAVLFLVQSAHWSRAAACMPMHLALQEALAESLMRYNHRALLKEMQRLRTHLELGGGDRARIEAQLRQARLLCCCSLHCSTPIHPSCCLSRLAVAAAAAAAAAAAMLYHAVGLC